MLKCGVMVVLSIIVVLAAAMDNFVGGTVEVENLKLPQGVNVVDYDGPLYELTEFDKISLAKALAGNESWTIPEGMPVIDLVLGTILNLGSGNLTKRMGDRVFNIYSSPGCPSGTWIAGVKNFGCGTGCINFNFGPASSGWLYQQVNRRPYPTAQVWDTPGCRGQTQSMGVRGLASCTTSNCGGIRSFMAFYGC